jgi:NAD(P)-dependent dehydrogenase (short-subunit alcohol dehydrogenase family)
MDPYSFDLTGKKAMVTGAGRGIGKAIAIGLARAGADVAICARTLSEVELTAARIRELGRKSVALKADVRVQEEVGGIFTKTLEEFGGLDILVNNAGGTFIADFMDISEKGWNAVVRENLTTVFLCCQEAGRIMVKEKKGSIINIASVAGMTPQPLRPAYGAAKAGIINLTQTLSNIWAPHNVRVNAIAPGYIETEGEKTLMEKTPEVKEQEIRRIPMGRAGQPEEIAAGVIYLASGAASFVTGITLVIAGGFSNSSFF